ncbi:MAG: hypothetical protein ABI036_18655 [Fibrobacteria bacterium]
MLKLTKSPLLFCLPLLFLPVRIHALKVLDLPKLDYQMAHEDTSSGRMYVSMDSGILVNEDSLVFRLQKFLKERKWDMWGDRITRVALFSEPLYAHPKESMQKRDIKAWADHYLAEFDSKKNIVWLFPAVPAKKKKIILQPSPR